MRILSGDFLLCNSEQREDVFNLDVEALQDEVKTLFENNTFTAKTDNYYKITAAVEYSKVFDEFEKYLHQLQKNNEQLTLVLLSHIELVDILRTLLRVIREGNWMLYFGAVREIPPWCFAYDHLNYALYLSSNYADMLALENDHPFINASFIRGGFCV